MTIKELIEKLQKFRDYGIRENRRERQWLDEWERLCEEGDDEIQDTDDEQ